jgi:hypothetical protein
MIVWRHCIKGMDAIAAGLRIDTGCKSPQNPSSFAIKKVFKLCSRGI